MFDSRREAEGLDDGGEGAPRLLPTSSAATSVDGPDRLWVADFSSGRKAATANQKGSVSGTGSPPRSTVAAPTSRPWAIAEASSAEDTPGRQRRTSSPSSVWTVIVRFCASAGKGIAKASAPTST